MTYVVTVNKRFKVFIPFAQKIAFFRFPSQKLLKVLKKYTCLHQVQTGC